MTPGRRSRAGVARGAAALAGLAAVSVGLPAVLCLSAASPLPWAFPELGQATSALAAPSGGPLFLFAARAAAWTAWAAWTLSAAAEVYARASGRPVRLAGICGSRVLVAAVLIGLGPVGPAALPAAAAAPAARPAAAATGPAAFAPAPTVATPSPPAPPDAAAGLPDAPGQQELLVFAGGLLSGAVVDALARLRRRQRLDRRPGRRIALPAGAAARRAERTARSSPAPAQAALAGAALAALAGGLRRGGQPLPAAAGLHLTPAGDVEVLLAEPAVDPPPPFAAVPGAGGLRWRLTAAAAAGLPPGTGGGSMLPGLVSAGLLDGGPLLVDLEGAGVTAAGDDAGGALARQFLAAALVELALNPWAGQFDLILDGPASLAAASTRASACSGLEEAIGLLEDRARSLPPVPPPGGARAARLADPSSPDWDLTLLAARTVPSPAQMGRILAVARPGSGIAALVPACPGGPKAPAGIALRQGPAGGHVTATVLPSGLAVTPPLLGGGAAAALDGLLGAALAPDTGPASSPYGEVPGPSAPGCPAPEGPGAGGGLSVSVLGPLAVTGPDGELHGKGTELVTALAFAGAAGLTAEELRGRLGPDEDTPYRADSLRQIISRTRAGLGADPSGTRWIIHSGGDAGRYRLHPAAALDWRQFSALAAVGRAARDPGPLRDALALLRGEPLSGLYWHWIDPALPEAIRAEITDAAALLSALEAGAGDPGAAARAARVGLAADSADEKLWRALMRAEDAAANTAGVHAAWKQCLAVISGIAAGGEPHPATAALYRELTAARPRVLPAQGGVLRRQLPNAALNAAVAAGVPPEV